MFQNAARTSNNITEYQGNQNKRFWELKWPLSAAQADSIVCSGCLGMLRNAHPRLRLKAAATHVQALKRNQRKNKLSLTYVVIIVACNGRQFYITTINYWNFPRLNDDKDVTELSPAMHRWRPSYFKQTSDWWDIMFCKMLSTSNVNEARHQRIVEVRKVTPARTATAIKLDLTQSSIKSMTCLRTHTTNISNHIYFTFRCFVNTGTPVKTLVSTSKHATAYSSSPLQSLHN
jgi:hypothetical protein